LAIPGLRDDPEKVVHTTFEQLKKDTYAENDSAYKCPDRSVSFVM
jgi:hypothetical protein